MSGYDERIIRLPSEQAGPSRLQVVLTTEGTYPHFRGGVSTWCDALMRGMPDVDFTVWSLMMNPFIAPQYSLPPNVKEFVGLPMWGIEEPVEYTPEVPAAKVMETARSTTERQAVEAFAPLLVGLMEEISSPNFDPFRFGRILHDIHVYFRTHDYRTTFRSQATWDLARAQLLRTSADQPLDLELDPEARPEGGPNRDEARIRLRELLKPSQPAPPANGRGVHLPTLNDATEGLRWLYRLMMPLNVPIPRAHLIHSTAAAFCGIPAILAKIEHGTPFLLTEHGVYMREQYLAIGRYGFPYYLKKFIVQMIAAVSRACFAYADRITPVCAYNARWELRNGAPRERISVIYNGVDAERFRPSIVGRPTTPTVVSIARVDPLKDLETFMRTADEVRKTLPEVRFFHYGPSVDREYDRKVRDLWRSLKLEGTVHLMGATDDPAAAYNKGDVVLLTSISEAFPYAVVEAMMCGKPVVSTDVGGVSEALEGTGRLARPRDHVALARGVLELLRLPEADKQALQRRCREIAERRFTLSGAVGAYRDMYDRLVLEAAAEAAERGQDAADGAPGSPGAHLTAGDPGEGDGGSTATAEEHAQAPGAGPAAPGPAQAVEPPVTAEPFARPPRHPATPSLTAADVSERIAAFDRARDGSPLEWARALRTALADADGRVRRHAASSIVSRITHDDDVLRQVARLAVADPEAPVRAAAALALAGLIKEQGAR